MNQKTTILPHHLKDLAEGSGLSIETIDKAGIYSINKTQLEKELGFKLPKNIDYTGLVFPYSETYKRFKVFPPVVLREGEKEVKYLQKKGSGIHVYNKCDSEKLYDTDFDLYITEGEKKALKATQEGLVCVGLGGIWNWKNPGSDEPVKGLIDIPVLNRYVYIVPDNDWIQNKNVMLATYRLGIQLEKLGAKARIVPLPNSSEKIGLDDYLKDGGRIELLDPIKLTHNIFKSNDLTKTKVKKTISGNPGGKELSGPGGDLKNILEKRLNYRFRNNVMLGIEYQLTEDEWTELDDRALNYIVELVNQYDGFDKTSKDKILQLVNSEHCSPNFDPFQDFFENNIWDGKKRIHSLFTCLEVENPELSKMLFCRWLVNCVPCMMGLDKNENCLVLQGDDQGIRKTDFLEGLFKRVPEFSKYHVTSKGVDPRNSDTMRLMVENCCINLDELEGMSRIEVNSIKFVFSLRDLKIRYQYDKLFSRKRRRASFCGTVNDREFLHDFTGSRRWFVIPITSMDFKKFESLDMRQVWLEAYDIYKTGTKYWLDQEEIKALNARNMEFFVSNIGLDLIKTRLIPASRIVNGIWMTTTEIARRLLEDSIVSSTFVQGLGKALKNQKFERRKGGNREWKIEFVRGKNEE